MGNCANKPLTNEGGEAAPVEKAVEATAVDAVEREIKVDENKVTVDTTADAATAEDQTKPRSLAQVLEVKLYTIFITFLLYFCILFCFFVRSILFSLYS